MDDSVNPGSRLQEGLLMSEQVILFISFFLISVEHVAVVPNQVVMTGICHYTQSKCWLLLWRDLPFQVVSKTPTTTTFTQKPFHCSFNSIAGGDWAFQISSILHWQSMWKGRAVQSRAPLCEFLGTPLALNCMPKSQQFPNSSILCQSDIHSHYCIFHAPASSIPSFFC